MVMGDSVLEQGEKERVEQTRAFLRKSCDLCARLKRACDGQTPCNLCVKRKQECTRSVRKKSGPAKGTRYVTQRRRLEEAKMVVEMEERDSARLYVMRRDNQDQFVHTASTGQHCRDRRSGSNTRHTWSSWYSRGGTRMDSISTAENEFAVPSHSLPGREIPMCRKRRGGPAMTSSVSTRARSWVGDTNHPETTDLQDGRVHGTESSNCSRTALSIPKEGKVEGEQQPALHPRCEAHWPRHSNVIDLSHHDAFQRQERSAPSCHTSQDQVLKVPTSNAGPGSYLPSAFQRWAWQNEGGSHNSHGSLGVKKGDWGKAARAVVPVECTMNGLPPPRLPRDILNRAIREPAENEYHQKGWDDHHHQPRQNGSICNCCDKTGNSEGCSQLRNDEVGNNHASEAACTGAEEWRKLRRLPPPTPSPSPPPRLPRPTLSPPLSSSMQSPSFRRLPPSPPLPLAPLSPRLPRQSDVSSPCSPSTNRQCRETGGDNEGETFLGAAVLARLGKGQLKGDPERTWFDKVNKNRMSFREPEVSLSVTQVPHPSRFLPALSSIERSRAGPGWASSSAGRVPRHVGS